MTNSKRKLVSRLSGIVATTIVCLGFICADAQARCDSGAIKIWEEQINNKPYQVSRILVKARPEQVWQIISDYSGATTVFTTLRKCQVLTDKGATKVVHYEMHPSGLPPTFQFQYDLEVREQPCRVMEWHRVAGDFKSVDGFWKLEPAEGGRSTLVTYATHVNGGLFLPQAFIKHQSHVDLPQVMAALKEHAENNVRIASQSRPMRSNSN